MHITETFRDLADVLKYSYDSAILKKGDVETVMDATIDMFYLDLLQFQNLKIKLSTGFQERKN